VLPFCSKHIHRMQMVLLTVHSTQKFIFVYIDIHWFNASLQPLEKSSVYLSFAGPGVALLVGRSRNRFPVVSLGIFSVVPPTEPCAQRSTQPLKVSSRDFSWGKGGRCVWLMTYHPCSAETSGNSRALIYPEPLGPPWPVAGWPLFCILFIIRMHLQGHYFFCVCVLLSRLILRTCKTFYQLVNLQVRIK